MFKKMPTMFISHGSPMNAISDNEFTRNLLKIGSLVNPKAIVVVSAHWSTFGHTEVQSSENNKTIHDFGGFPKELYDVEYLAPGSVILANKIKNKLPFVKTTDSWGLDHGSWSVLKHMYPKANVPVLQVSIDRKLSDSKHYELGCKLEFLREDGVLLIASGNVSHNLSRVDFSNQTKNPSAQWAKELNDSVHNAINDSNVSALINYKKLPGANIGIASNDHYLPLLYALGSDFDKKKKHWLYQGFELGTLSMDCVAFE